MSETSDWLANLRRHERWKEGRLVTVRVGAFEGPALTQDLSIGGLRLAVHGTALALGAKIEVEIAFENDIVKICGVVQRVTKKPWGSIVGVRFEETGQGFLATRYLSHPR